MIVKLKEIEDLKRALTENKYVILNTFGNSMYPTIKKYDKIVVKAIDEKISKNDIVIFFNKNGNEYVIVAHRVINIIGEKFALTKGDNNASYDPPIRIKNIFAKVIKIIRFKDTE